MRAGELAAGLSRTVEGLRRPARVETLVRSGIIDLAFYEAQTGRGFRGARQAARHYLDADPADDLSLHPLFEAAHLERLRSADDPMLRYLSRPALYGKVSPHPLFDLVAAGRALGAQAGRGPGGLWLAWVLAAADDTPVPVPAGLPPATWGELRAELIEVAARWRELRGVTAGAVAVGPSERASVPKAAASPEPLVSVLIAAHNQAPRLRASIDSVLAQAHRALELVVVDDGSTDDTAGVLTGIARFDPRVRCLRLPRTAGGAARNAGLAAATGAYVAFLEPGRRWKPDFLTRTVGALQRHGWLLAHADGPSTVDRRQLLAGRALPLSAVVVETALARATGFDETLPVADDHDFLIRAGRTGPIHAVGVAGLVPTAGRPDRAAEADAAGWRAAIQDRHSIDWAAADGTPRQPGRTSLIVGVGLDLPAALAHLPLLQDDSLELVVGGIRTRGQYACLHALARGRRIVIDHREAGSWALLANLAAQCSTGEHLVLAKPGAAVEPALSGQLLAALADPAVAVAQPINCQPDDTVHSAGAGFAPGSVVPAPLLAGHALADAERLGEHTLPAAHSAVIAVRATDFLALHGFDPRLGNSLPEVDLSLRAAECGLGGTVLVPAGRVTVRSQTRPGFRHDTSAAARVLQQRWAAPPPGSAECLADAGFTVLGYDAMALGGSSDPRCPQHVLLPRVTPLRPPAADPPALRWTIDTAAPALWWGNRWGDVHFAHSLAAALRRLGQQVAIDRREARERPTRRFDDVVLTLRGLDGVRPVPGPVNLLWVISHPEDVTADEVAGYDLAFAAGPRWAADRSAEWGVELRPLLQCTDPGRFRPGLAAPDSGPAALFVGNARKAGRPIIDETLRAGFPLAIYGADWDRSPAREHVMANQVDNAEVGRLYAGAGVVLNDHWADMRRFGFLSNRLFDAVACGARVLSDAVPGTPELFDGCVQVAEAPSDVARLLREPAAFWPDLPRRLATAQRIRDEHSFDRRARTLLDAVLEVLGNRTSDGPRRRPVEPAGSPVETAAG